MAMLCGVDRENFPKCAPARIQGQVRGGEAASFLSRTFQGLQVEALYWPRNCFPIPQHDPDGFLDQDSEV